MPYQGSAQSAGFRNRPVADPSKRMRQEAGQIEEQGEKRIRQMERQASQRIQEMRRVSDIQANNADYELRVLSKFSKTLTDTLREQGEQYVERERMQGMMDYMNQSPEALQQDSEEVDQAYAKGAEIHSQMSDLAAKAPDKETGARIRQGSRYYKQGWDLAGMNQAAAGFPAHLLAELKTSEVMLADPNGGPAFKIKDHEGIDQWQYAADYIKQQYILKNNPAGLSAKVLATKFMPQLNQAISTQRRDYTTKYLQEQDQLALDSEENILYESMVNPNSPIKPEAAFPAFLKNVAKLQDGGFKGARGLVKDIYTRIASENPQRALELIPILLSTKIDHPSAKKGGGTLAQLFGDEFNEKELKRIATDSSYNLFTKNQSDLKMKATEAYQAIDEQFRGKAPSDSEKRKAAADFLQQYGTTEEGQRLARKILSYDPMFLDRQTSEELATEYRASNPGGQISEEQAKNFDPATYNRLKDEGVIVDDLFGSKSKEAITKGKAIIDAQLSEVLSETSRLTKDSVQFELAQQEAHKEMMNDAYTLMRENPGLSEKAAILKAAENKAAEIESQQKTGGKYKVRPSGVGMEYFNPKLSTNAVTMRQGNYLKDTVAKTSKNKDAVIKELIVKDKNDLELAADGRPPVFFYAMAGRANGRYSAYEILNAQRGLQGLAPVKTPPEVEGLDGFYKKYPELRRVLLQNPTSRVANRSLEQVGGISAANLLKAIGFQESGGNYKSENRDPATGNDRDPALGKYQILWSNVLAWGPKYGLGVPSSQNAFLNDPQYQEDLARAAMGEYIRQSLNASGGDVNQAIRRAAAFWYGGPRGFNNYDNPNFSGGPGYPNMQQYTNKILQRYRGGY